MKKLSRSINPVQHESVNTIDVSVQDLLQQDNLDNKNKKLIESIGEILKKYREVQEQDLTSRNNYLIQFISDTYEKLFQPYIDDFSKVVDLKKIIEDVIKENNLNTSSKIDISSDIIDVVTKAIKSIKSRRIKRKIQSQKKDVQNSEDSDIDLENVFDRIINHKSFKTLQSTYDKNEKENTKQIVDLYKERCKKFANQSKSKIKITKNNTKSVKHIQNNEITQNNEKLKKIHTNILNRQFQFIEFTRGLKDYFSNIRGLFKAFRSRVKNIFKSVFSALHRIGSFVWSGLRIIGNLTLVPVFKGIKFIGKGIMKTVKFLGRGIKGAFKLLRLDKLCKMIGSGLKTVGKALKNSLLAFLKTPAGMYFAGVVIGYVWTKLYNKIKAKISSIKIPKKKDDKDDKDDSIFSGITEFLDPLKNFIYTIHNDIIYPTVKFLSPILTAGKNIAKALLDFGQKHPWVSSFILALIPVIQTLASYSATFRTMKMAGDPISALIAGGMVFIAEGLKNLFSERNDDNFKVLGQKRAIYAQFDNSNKFSQFMSDDNRKKYELMIAGFNEENSSLIEITTDIEQMKKRWANKNTKYNLWLEIPDFVQAVFDSKLFPFEKTALEGFKRFAEKNDTMSQINELTKYLNIRYDKLIALRGTLSTARSSKELEDRMNNIGKFENNRFVGFTDTASHVLSDIERNNGEQFSNYSSTWNEWFGGHIRSNEAKQEREMEGVSAQLSGDEFTDSHVESEPSMVSPTSMSVGLNPPARKTVKTLKKTQYQQLQESEASDDKQTVSIINSYNEAQRTILQDNIDIKTLKGKSAEEKRQIFEGILGEWTKKLEEQKAKEEVARQQAEKDKIEELNKESEKIEAQIKELDALCQTRYDASTSGK